MTSHPWNPWRCQGWDVRPFPATDEPHCQWCPAEWSRDWCCHNFGSAAHRDLDIACKGKYGKRITCLHSNTSSVILKFAPQNTVSYSISEKISLKDISVYQKMSSKWKALNGMYSFNLKQQQQQQLIRLVRISLSTDPPFCVEFVALKKPECKGPQNK